MSPSAASPLVSVVIPTYNRAKDLERAIGSVLAQSWPHWEMVVVDNNSTDNTAEVVAGFNDARIQLVPVRNNGIIAASRNRGVELAQGKYIAFLDADDWWRPEKLDASVRALEHGADVVYHCLRVMKSTNQRVQWRRARTWNLSAPVLDDLLARGNALATSSVVLRRSIFTDVGGMSEDPTLVAYEDYDCWLRIAQRTDAFQRLPDTLGYYWVGGGNTTTAERTLRNLRRIEEMYFSPTTGRRVPGWAHYGKGRACYALQRFSEASRHLEAALDEHLSPSMRIKAVATLALSKIRRGSSVGRSP